MGLSDILSTLATEIDSYLDTQTGKAFATIPVNTRRDTANYPYCAYNDISTNFDNVINEYKTQETIQGDDENITEKSYFEDSSVISYSITDKDEASCRNYSELLENWFRCAGYDFLKANNMTAEIERATQNTSIVLAGATREYRYGFDVRIRYINIVSQTKRLITDIIPTITINDE